MVLPVLLLFHSYVIGRCKNVAVKAGTSIQTGLPALLAHSLARLPCLCSLLALLICCYGCLLGRSWTCLTNIHNNKSRVLAVAGTNKAGWLTSGPTGQAGLGQVSITWLDGWVEESLVDCALSAGGGAEGGGAAEPEVPWRVSQVSHPSTIQGLMLENLFCP